MVLEHVGYNKGFMRNVQTEKGRILSKNIESL